METNMWCTPTKNREQVTFWAKWVFGIIVRSTFSFTKFILLLFEIQSFANKNASSFSGSVILGNRPLKLPCDFEKSAFKASYSYSFGFHRLRKMQNFFVGKCLKISQKLHGGDRKHIMSKNKNLKIDRWPISHPYANLNCPYLKQACAI